MSEAPLEIEERARRQNTEHMSPHYATGLGRYAVGMALIESRYIVAVDRMDTGILQDDLKSLARGFENEKAVGLQAAREELAALPKGYADHINSYFDQHGPSEWLKHALGVSGEHPDFVAALTAKDQEGYLLSDDIVLNFLEWHNHELAGEQAELDKASEAYKHDYSQTFQAAVAEGWIPESALPHLDRLKDTNLVIDDHFGTTYKHRAAYAGLEVGEKTQWVSISPFEFLDPQGLRHTILHELTHTVDGRQERIEVSPENANDRGMCRIFGEGEGGVAMTEAMTEQLAICLERGRGFNSPHTSYYRGREIYLDERMLLDTLATNGIVSIDMRLFYEAYFENSEDAELKGDTSARSCLRRALHEAFPFRDVVADIKSLKQKDINAYEEELLAQSLKYREEMETRGKVLAT